MLLVISGYLFVWFAGLNLYKAAILRSVGVQFDFYGLALIKALILGKFILLGHMLKVGERRTAHRRAVDIIVKSLIFVVLLLMLDVLEEFIVGYFHGRSPGEVLSTIDGGSLLELVATCFLMLLVLIPYFAFREIAAGMEPGAMAKLLTERV